ncbi:hypothetical protein OWV82_011783 [Melia azedarach]|uniref:Uncharacterized protein n=1 Tax=Melia azedarach TaxID=155640 RepID=A0ACC1Y1K4_MELAZ|nr:hypothetical protein OWV82_011783 [Melia azedarach]
MINQERGSMQCSNLRISGRVSRSSLLWKTWDGRQCGLRNLWKMRKRWQFRHLGQLRFGNDRQLRHFGQLRFGKSPEIQALGAAQVLKSEAIQVLGGGVMVAIRT